MKNLFLAHDVIDSLEMGHQLKLKSKNVKQNNKIIQNCKTVAS